MDMHNDEWEDIWVSLLHLLFINTMIKYDNCVQLCFAVVPSSSLTVTIL